MAFLLILALLDAIWPLYVKLFKLFFVPYILCKQTFCVKWGLHPLMCQMVWVRQSGILSPVIFTFYLEDLNSCMAIVVIPYFMLIIARSPVALQILLDCCQECAEQSELVNNETKTKCMVFKSQSMLDLHVPIFYLNGAVLDKVRETEISGYNCNW